MFFKTILKKINVAFLRILFIIPKCTLQVGEVPCLGKCVKYPFLMMSIFSFLLQPPSRHLLTHRNSPNPQILPGVPLVVPQLGLDFLLISR